MRTKEEMEAASSQHLERDKATAKRHCDATVAFGGPLKSGSQLRFCDGHTYWQKAPAGEVEWHARWAAFDLLRIAPGEFATRQEAMVAKGREILLDQIRAAIGERAWGKLAYSPALRSMEYFWEYVIRFAEPNVTHAWIERYKSKLLNNDEQDRREKYEAAERLKAEKTAKRRKIVKRGKAVRS